MSENTLLTKYAKIGIGNEKFIDMLKRKRELMLQTNCDNQTEI